MALPCGEHQLEGDEFSCPPWLVMGGGSCQPEDVGLAPKGLLFEAGPQARVTFFGAGCQATTEWAPAGQLGKE